MSLQFEIDKPSGRYAPSPTGPLHLGSLLAAVASFLQARGQDASWLLRIDDIDTPRVVPGAASGICEILTAFGLQWDGPVLYQSRRRAAYRDAAQKLKALDLAFDCACTRREAQSGPAGLEGPIYPGTCRDGIRSGREPRSVRMRVDSVMISFVDAIQGMYAQDVGREVGDFVIRRADGITAYQLATVLDDAFQGVSEIVRGADLLSSTPRQILLQRQLSLPQPRYAHVPVLVDRHGEKLSKSTGALALDVERKPVQFWECLTYLGQQPPDSLRDASLMRLHRWAADNWQIQRVPRLSTLDV